MLGGILKVAPSSAFLVRLFFVSGAALLVVGTFFCRQEFADQPALAPSEVPFELVGGFLIEFEGQIGEMHGLKFILDTGATRSIVSEKIARNLSVNLRPTKILDFTKPVNLSEGTFSRVTFGPIHLTQVALVVGNLGKVSPFAKGADAIIGSDLLLCGRLTIDYEQDRLIFGPLDSPAPVESAPRRGFVLQLHLQDVSVDVLLDTGVQGIVLFKDRLHQTIPTLTLHDANSAVIGQWAQASSATVPGLYLGPQAIEDQVLFVKGPPNNALPGISGYLGTSPLHAHRIEIDFERKSFKWR